ncbi:pseudouridine synthase [Pseudoroseomonas wenyumeiae]
MEPHPEGQPATTLWRVLGRAPGLCWLELRPRTGRTHQLRVHCAALGFPILGDPFYGTPAPGGLHLLARAIRLPLSPPVMAEAPVPAAMRPALPPAAGKPEPSRRAATRVFPASSGVKGDSAPQALERTQQAHHFGPQNKPQRRPGRSRARILAR